MAKEAVTSLRVETGESEKTIKQLRDEIKWLKKSLEEATIGSDAFEQASKELSQAQNELKSVLDSTKQSVEDAEGSYNALSKQMSELKKEWKATNDEAKRNQLGEQIDKINNELKELDATIGNHQRNVGNYKQDIIDAFEEIELESKDYATAWREVQEETEQTRARFEAVQKTASGLASGFSAVQGAMALLGSENEALEKTFLKVQSAMAIAQGVGGLKDLVEGIGQAKVAFSGAVMGVKAFISGLSAMKTALISTGIGALVVGVGMLVAYWEDLTALFDDTEEKIKDIERESARLKETLKTEDREFNFFIAMKEAAGATREEILKLRYEYARTKELTYFEELKEKQKELKKLKEENKNAFWWWEGDTELEEVLQKEVDEMKKTYQELILAREDAFNAIQIYNEQEKTRKIKEAQERAKERTNEAKKQAEETKKQREEAIKELEEYLKTEQDRELSALSKLYEEKKKLIKNNGDALLNLEVWYNKERSAIVNKYIQEEKEKIKELEQLDRELITGLYNKDISDSKSYTSTREKMVGYYYDDVMSDYSDNKIMLIQLEINKTLELQKIQEDGYVAQIAMIQEILNSSVLSAESRAEYEQQLIDLQEERVYKTMETNATIKQLNKDFINQQIEDNKALKKNITTTFTSALSSVQSVLSTIQGDIDTTNREGFEKNKKLQKSNATIGMLVGITNALSGAFTSKSGIWDWILAGIQATSIATSGAIQIANINKQRFDGGDADSVSVTPNMNINDSMPIQYTRELLTDTETTELNRSTKVYVLESEITETQDNVRVKEANSSF